MAETLKQKQVIQKASNQDLGKKPGVVFTPTELALQLLAPLAKDLRRKNMPIRVLEPSSGAGDLLCATIQLLEQSGFQPSKVHIDSVEIDSAYIKKQKERIRRLFPRWLSAVHFSKKDFLFEFQPSDSYDLVVMNPPWVGFKQMEPSYRNQVGRAFDLRGQFDLLDAFVIKATKHANNKAQLAMFLPDKVLSSHQPSNCLKLLAHDLTSVSKVDLAVDFFPGVQHESVYLSFRKTQRKKTDLPTTTQKAKAVTVSDVFELFRGLELSGRSSEYLVDNQSESLDRNRVFISGTNLLSDGTLDLSKRRFVSKNLPTTMIKEQFEYKGPAVLVRKTGSPVHACYVESLPFISQVVFAVIPKQDTPKSRAALKLLAKYLRSPEGQNHLQANSGKLERATFPYITMTDLKKTPIDPIELGILAAMLGEAS